MKKFFTLLLVFFLIFCLSACNRYNTPIENIERRDCSPESGEIQRVSITISKEEQLEIVSILNNSDCFNDVINSAPDYEFSVNGVRMGYVADGFFKDYDHACTLELSEADTRRVNEILGYENRYTQSSPVTN